MTARKKTSKKTGKKTKRAGSTPDGKEPSFEDALKRLETIVSRLEEGEVPLEESLQAYAEGTRLVQLCMSRLERAETMIRELTENAEGFDLAASSLQVENGDPEEDGEEEDEGEEQDELPF